ncbi:cadherin repeat domain-containing protein [Flavobacterium ustbae]|uniref:cadherin repeat domain-containing protein n=1 Tax=Flavobacterium ustbae TaxID=2488790 RepID=UPI000F7ACE0F|nr:cadherin repeat domain-containing protein [Flavobacterium ustbae]
MALLALSMTACSSDNEQTPQKQIDMNLAPATSITYGEKQNIALPSSVLDASDLKISLDFSLNENVKVNASENLNDKLSKAVTVSKESGAISVNTTLLYPNGAVSSAGIKIPDSYKIIVNASSESQNFQGKQTIDFKIIPAKLIIKGIDNKTSIPVGYVIYGDAANFELETPENITANMNWAIENPSSIGTEVTFSSNVLKFASNAGDPDKKAEKAYDVTPILLKDGFTVASTTFRVVFIPKIKFFYGTYYPEYDLTILLNNLHIALSNGYVSAAPAFSPENYKSSFVINGIKKDGQTFTDAESIFSINEKTGSITVKKSDLLTEGAYEITVKAVTTTGLEFLTTLTLNMSKV